MCREDEWPDRAWAEIHSLRESLLEKLLEDGSGEPSVPARWQESTRVSCLETNLCLAFFIDSVAVVLTPAWRPRALHWSQCHQCTTKF